MDIIELSDNHRCVKLLHKSFLVDHFLWSFEVAICQVKFFPVLTFSVFVDVKVLPISGIYYTFIGGYIQNAEVCKENGSNTVIGKLS